MRRPGLRATIVFAGALIVLVVGVRVAEAHHPEITARWDCDGNLSWTATAWVPDKGDDHPVERRTHVKVVVTAFGEKVQTGKFLPDGFSFSGSKHYDTPATVKVRATAEGKWGPEGDQHYGSSGEFRETTATPRTDCPSPTTTTVAQTTTTVAPTTTQAPQTTVTPTTAAPTTIPATTQVPATTRPEAMQPPLTTIAPPTTTTKPKPHVTPKPKAKAKPTAKPLAQTPVAAKGPETLPFTGAGDMHLLLLGVGGGLLLLGIAVWMVTRQPRRRR